MEFDTDVLRAVYLKQTGRTVAVERNLGVGIVLGDDDVVAIGKPHNLFVEAERRHGAGWIVRVVNEHEPSPSADVLRDRVEVRKEAILAPKRHGVGNATGEDPPPPPDSDSPLWHPP